VAVRLGLNLGYWGMGNDADNLALARRADELGYAVVWAAEAYGSDSPSVLAFLAGQTRTIDLGAAVMQIPARSPAMTAMTAATLDALSGGRFRLGLGVSGPQVSEGWHGVRFDQPLGRTREYVDIVNLALSRQRVRYDGKHYQLPLADGPGKALSLTVHPVREHIPIYLAAVGPKNLELAGEIADGWLAIFFAPEAASEQLAHVRAGRARRDGVGGERTVTDAAGVDGAGVDGAGLDGFDVVTSTPVVFGADPVACAVPIRPYAALYLGGMGSKDKNFYHALATRMGYGAAADEVQRHYLSRDYAAAADAVPAEFVDRTALLGPPTRVAERMHAFAEAGVTTLSITPHAATLGKRLEALDLAAEALQKSGSGS
jgi:alkanesulfonate monooxygenase SsuD/methylene tetrahydromethanopterin reductase-like flavin-dependent oxidoreductase (luciferase family)